VKLFVQSAIYIQLKYKLEAGYLNAVNRLRHLVQRMPPGIEVTTASIDTRSPEEIAGEIEASLDFLTSNHRAMEQPCEQQTDEHAIITV
jgi:hypothetical protein